MTARRAELADNLERVRARIAAACAAAGRDPAELTLVAVTKTYPAADVIHLAALGVQDIGENRDQEAAPKAAEVARAGVAVRWHFVGRLQRNKCRSVARYADLVHSVDSVRLAAALGRAAAQERDRPLEVLVQVSLDGAPGRGGAVADEVPAVARAVAAEPALRLRGVMAVAPLAWRPEDAFARLGEVAAQIRAEYPQAEVVSAGMSADLEAAVAAGATHLRIGSGLLGERPMLR
ncbi:MAG TPA: YggS family pyridoxal phosphate-dependent enzyme [Natronosporangium sp.]|nr:YggS family pyridoxal phosphate-dependent enzyme [Natronosporangium sp.]